jgi:hypothetical protein
MYPGCLAFVVGADCCPQHGDLLCPVTVDEHGTIRIGDPPARARLQSIADLWLQVSGRHPHDSDYIDPWEERELVPAHEADAYRRAYGREIQRARAKAGVETRRDSTAKRDAALMAAVRDLRAKHPQWKTRTIAGELHRRKQPRPDDDTARANERKAVNALAKKIRLLERRSQK